MEKRFVLFVVLSVVVMSGYIVAVELLLPKKNVAQLAEQKVPDADEKKVEDEPPGDASAPAKESSGAADQKAKDPATAEKPPADAPSPAPSGSPTDTPERPAEPSGSETRGSAEKPEERVIEAKTEPQRISLGSYAPEKNFAILVTLNNRGAALERVELTARGANGKLKYQDLEHRQTGYLGHLALEEDEKNRWTIRVVGDGTPAAQAVSSDPGATVGLRAGDLVYEVDGKPLLHADELSDRLLEKKPGDSLTLVVGRRDPQGQESRFTYSAKLGVRPLELIQPEKGEFDYPLSCLLTLIPASQDSTEEQLANLAHTLRLWEGNWETQELPGADPGVEFRMKVEVPDAKQPGQTRPMEVIKRYRIHTGTNESGQPNAMAYHIDLEVEVVNRSDELQRISYRLDGPNGLPLEGWWYSTKVHPRMFHSAGARDVLCRTAGEGRRLIGCPEIQTKARKTPKNPDVMLFVSSDSEPIRRVNYLAVDTQYFLAALKPLPPPSPTDEKKEEDVPGVAFRQATAVVLGNAAAIPKNLVRTANTSFQLYSEPKNLEPGTNLTQRFELFVGPKDPELLATYGLADAIEYGWFPLVVKPLQGVLHFFHQIVGNYGIAIVMLTLMVRGGMFPLSRKAAQNAQMMQELAPEMKKIAERYKNDMEKRAVAQQQLFKENNYNPLSGCWMMFVQLPIFIGLYRCLAIDIQLRQAPLIPGLDWASNLAGPDWLMNWEGILPGFFADRTGWLGPYLNVLPFITISLFLLQQKLFTPPATDEQQQMQLTMMKWMTVFMGVMFYKVASGLCIYFIASSLWSIGERKLLPKAKRKAPAALAPPGTTPANETWLAKLKRHATNGNEPPPGQRPPGPRPSKRRK